MSKTYPQLEQSAPSITIGIVDDHPIFAEALAVRLGTEPDFQVIGLADSCAAARELVGRACPNVLLLDVSLPDGDGLELVPELKARCPEVHILVLTAFSDERTLLRSLDTGISGFVGKNRPAAEVLAAVRQAAADEMLIPTSLLVGLLSRVRHAQQQPTGSYQEPLTAREHETLVCLARGMSSAAIANTLDISPMTVRTHIRNLMSKLNVHSRLAAVAYALRQGLIDPPP